MPMKIPGSSPTPATGCRGDGPHHQIVISSRVRLARNLRNHAFPGWAKKAERLADPRRDQAAGRGAAGDAATPSRNTCRIFRALEKQVLVERHLISREHAAKGVGSAVVMNRKQTLQHHDQRGGSPADAGASAAGFQLKNAFKLIDKVDSALEQKLDFAFHPQLGYLTACPTNVGTGMRASAMVHLPGPGAERADQPGHPGGEQDRPRRARPLRRGHRGDGQPLPGLQPDHARRKGGRDHQPAEQGHRDRSSSTSRTRGSCFCRSKPARCCDQIGRAYGILTHAHSMTSKEALNLLSVHEARRRSRFFPDDERVR